jgi:hypothetical protein
MEQMASLDFFVVPTATFRVLFVFVALSHARRRVLHFQVTDHPSQEWTMQQVREAFPWDHGCRYLLRDRDAIYGHDLVGSSNLSEQNPIWTMAEAAFSNSRMVTAGNPFCATRASKRTRFRALI